MLDLKSYILYPKSPRGFTLVELVVVISILALILSATVTLLNPIKQIEKGKLAKKESDLEQMRSALDLYYDDKKCYPKVGEIPFGKQWKSGSAIYMAQVPQPENSLEPYTYVTSGTCPQWYVLYAKASQANSGISPYCPLNCRPADDKNNHLCAYGGIVDCSYISSISLGD